MSATEKKIIAEAGKLRALRERVMQTAYMTTGEVRAHLHMSRATLYAVPPEVLPYALTPGGDRRYHPADVLAYPARMRRLDAARTEAKREEVLAGWRRELDARDEAAIQDAAHGWAA